MIKKIHFFILNMKLRYKLIITYILISIIPLTIMGVLNIGYVKSNMNNLQKQNIDYTLEKLDLELNARINTINQTCLNISLNTNTQYILSNTEQMKQNIVLYNDLLHNSFDPLIEIIHGLDNNIQAIEVYSIHDIPVHDPVLYGNEELEQKAWYPTTKTLQPFQPYIFASGDNLEIIYQINSKYSQELLGFIVLTMAKQDFFPVAISSVDEHTGFEIRDTNSNIIYTTGDVSPDMLSASLNHKETNLQITMCQKQNFASYGYIGIFFIILSCILVSCLLVIISSLIVSHKITSRIDHLLDQMAIVSKGILDIEIQSNSTDEIGELTERFSQLVKQLKQVFEDMYHAELQAKNSEMVALQSQISPHFLYNTLNMIQWKAIDANAYEICDIIQKLSTFYRTALNSGHNLISVKSELDNLKSYLSLQQFMQPDKFDIEYHIDPIVLDYKLIKFILQPIAENALEHGFAVNSSQKGLIIVRAEMIDDKLAFTIQDNGTGMNSSKLEELKQFSSSGYGLKNIKERLDIQYGTDYEFRIESVPFQGTTVKIIIPTI